MAGTIDDIDKLQNSLTEVLGAETNDALSAEQPARPILGVEAVAAYGTFLALKFAAAFLGELKKKVEDEVVAAAVRLADKTAARVKQALQSMKPTDAGGPAERKAALEAADQTIRPLAGVPPAKSDLALKSAKAQVAADLKSHGVLPGDADAKADEFVRVVLAHAGGPR